MDKKLIKMIGIVIGCFILLLIILMLLVSCENRKTNYSKIETNMKEAAIKYFKANQKELPSEDGSSKDVKLSKLISDGYIKDPNSSNKNNGTSCDGYVSVTNNNGYYLFSPKLTCGKDYSTTFLKDKIISDNDNGVESGFGLYQTSNNEYIFKGDTVNNYVTMNDKNYRIIRINEDGTIRLINIDTSNDTYVWDDRYNSDVGSANIGINDYYNNDINSRVKDTVQSIYTNNYTDAEKAYITTQTLCIGKRSEDDITKDGSTECSVQLENQQLGLITVYEYMQASLDNGCTETTASSCENYNWIYNLKSMWTLTGDTEQSSKVYVINKVVRKNLCSSYQRVLPVLNLTDKAIYVSGSGTETDPYVFK